MSYELLGVPILLTVHTSRPATGPTNPFGKFCVDALDATRAGFNQFCALYPTNPLVASKGGNIVPRGKRCLVFGQYFTYVCRKRVYGSTWEGECLHTLTIAKP